MLYRVLAYDPATKIAKAVPAASFKYRAENQQPIVQLLSNIPLEPFGTYSFIPFNAPKWVNNLEEPVIGELDYVSPNI